MRLQGTLRTVTLRPRGGVPALEALHSLLELGVLPLQLLAPPQLVPHVTQLLCTRG